MVLPVAPLSLIDLLRRLNLPLRGLPIGRKAGRKAIPLELKILGALRMLGGGTCLDGIKELSFMSTSTMDAFLEVRG
jgi:hypothetical protein